MQISFLGTGAPLSATRATLGILIKAEQVEPLLIDSCGGFELYRRLDSIGEKLSEIKHLIISHKHGDHMAGIMAMTLASLKPSFYGLADTMQAAKQLLEITYPNVAPVLDLAPKYNVINYSETAEIAGYKVSFFKANHRVETIAIRVEHGGKVFAFSADSIPSQEIVNCAKDADLFVCDALCAGNDLSPERLKGLMHPSAAEAAKMANEAGAKSLAMVHIARFANITNMLTEARANFAGAISIPNDGSHYII